MEELRARFIEFIPQLEKGVGSLDDNAFDLYQRIVSYLISVNVLYVISLLILNLLFFVCVRSIFLRIKKIKLEGLDGDFNDITLHYIAIFCIFVLMVVCCAELNIVISKSFELYFIPETSVLEYVSN